MNLGGSSIGLPLFVAFSKIFLRVSRRQPSLDAVILCLMYLMIRNNGVIKRNEPNTRGTMPSPMVRPVRAPVLEYRTAPAISIIKLFRDTMIMFEPGGFASAFELSIEPVT